MIFIGDMLNNNRIFASFRTGVLRLSAVIVLVFAVLFSLRAQVYCARDGFFYSRADACSYEAPDTVSVFSVFFAVDDDVVYPGFMANHRALTALDKALASVDPASVESLFIEGSSSPEGNYNYNVALAHRRAASLKRYIASNFPAFESKIVLSDGVVAMSAEASEYWYSRFASIKLVKPDSSAADFGGAAAAAQSSASSPCKVLFDLESVSIDPDFRQNSCSIESIDQMLSGRSADEFSRIVITAGCSPDGPVAKNQKVSALRGEVVKDYISEKYPEFAGKTVVCAVGEDWDELRSVVASDTSLTDSEKSVILAVIDSDENVQAKEAALRKLGTWTYIQDELLPLVRYAKVVPEYAEVAPEEPAEVTPDEPAEEISDESAIILPEITVDDSEIADEQIKLDDSRIDVQSSEIQTPYIPWPTFAVSTNLLGELAMVTGPIHFTPNIAVEIPLGQKFSVLGNYTFPWWISKDNSKAWQILKWDLGARWWFSPHDKSHPMDVLRGHFLGVDISSGYYDIEPNHKGYQGEFQLAGLEYGYSWALSEHWRLEANIGAGIMATHYRYYEADAYDDNLILHYNGRMTWFGPTKAGLSIKYVFSKNRTLKKDKEGSR